MNPSVGNVSLAANKNGRSLILSYIKVVYLCWWWITIVQSVGSHLTFAKPIHGAVARASSPFPPFPFPSPSPRILQWCTTSTTHIECGDVTEGYSPNSICSHCAVRQNDSRIEFVRGVDHNELEGFCNDTFNICLSGFVGLGSIVDK